MSYFFKTTSRIRRLLSHMRCLINLVLLCIPPLVAADLSKLEWMAGCWTTAKAANGLRIDEHWSRPEAGNMLGYSRTFKGERMVFFEFMRLEARDAEIVYTPRYGTSQKPVGFRLVKLNRAEAVFENLEHDFPQRIIYKRQGDTMNAAIEGSDKGKARRQEFPYVRSACP